MNSHGIRFLRGAVPDSCISACQICLWGRRRIKVEGSLRPATFNPVAAPREDHARPQPRTVRRLPPCPLDRRPPRRVRRPRKRGIFLEDDATPPARLCQEVREEDWLSPISSLQGSTKKLFLDCVTRLLVCWVSQHFSRPLNSYR